MTRQAGRESDGLWTARTLRTRRGPWRAVLGVVVSLVMATLLNAEALQSTASSLEAGWRRDAAMTVMDPLVGMSKTLRLTVPRNWLDDLVRNEEPAPVATEPEPSPAPSPSLSVTAEPSVAPDPTTSPPTPSPTPSMAPSAQPARLVATADQPARLFVTGDSMTEALGPALANLALATGVVDPDYDIRYSSGLTRPDFYDWPAEVTRRLGDAPADIVVFMVGANDAQPIEIAGGWEPYGTQAWFAEYRQRAAEMASVLSRAARTSYWIGQPIARSESFRSRMQALNDMHREAAAGFGNVTFVPSWSVFLDDAGGYADYLPDADQQLVRVRRNDGIHLTPEGGEWLAGEILGVIRQDWDLGSSVR